MDIVTSRVFVDGERGITAAKLNDIVGSSVIQPAFYTAKPTASSLAPTDIMLAVKAGAYVQSTFQTVIDSVSAGINSDNEIWSVRLRSYNLAGNPNFEIDQRNAGAGVINIANGVFACDRWAIGKLGTHTLNIAQESGSVAIPGINYTITQKRLALQLTTQQASLAAGDVLQINQFIEGPAWREISGYPFSVSLLVYSDVALKFSFAIRSGAQSIVKLCTVPAAAWTIVSLPNIPTPTTPFPILPGGGAGTMTITLSCGTTNIAPAADTWQSANYVGAPGMDNWSSKPVNTGFRLGFVQVEPGPVCSTFQDKPFSQNYDECLRYYSKSYDYGTVVGTVTGVGRGATTVSATYLSTLIPSLFYPKPLAVASTTILRSPTTGAINTVHNERANADVAVSTVGSGQRGIHAINLGAAQTANDLITYQYTADSGW